MLKEDPPSEQRTLTVEQAINLGVQHQDAGDSPKAESIYRQILQVDPNQPDALHLLGMIAHKARKYDIAVELISKAIAIRPDYTEAHNNLGNTFKELGKMDDAVASYRKALAITPDFALSHVNLGIALKEQGKPDEAVASYLKALAINPDFAEAHYHFGNVLKSMGKMDEAVASYRKAIAIKPDYQQAHNNLGNVLERMGNLDEAAASYKKALSIKPDYAEALYNLGNAHQNLGRLEDAIASYQEALAIKPDFAKAHDNMLLSEQYRLGHDAGSLFELHRRWDEQHGEVFRADWPVHSNDPDPERRLRIGFVSPDLGRHPVGYFVAPMLGHLGAGGIETVCYSDRTGDDLTEKIKAAADIWRDVDGVSDDDLNRMIIDDQIDILIDLTGHSANNRLPVLARKPAPLQVAWAGYVGTTGLAAIDYLVSDIYSTPPEDEPFYSEKVIRMPDGWLCYEPPEYAPDVGPPPSQQNGYITFCSFSNPTKVNQQVVSLWARILEQVPDSRLLIKYRGIDSTGNTDRIEAMFEAEGIDRSRLMLEGRSPHPELLGRYNEADIALDPFPYSGGLTTYEALWMGVPVITLPGDTFASRHSLSHLSTIGLPELVASDADDYVALAVRLAKDTARLANLRSELRDMMATSPICDGKKFAEGFAGLMRKIWRDWCALGNTGDVESATIQQNLGIAVQHHTAGRLPEAEAAYRQILQADPNQPDALHLLGVISSQVGKSDVAVELITKALAVRPDFPEAHSNLGAALRDLGQLDEAVASYRKAIAIKPDYTDAHYNLGNALQGMGRSKEAVASYQKTVSIKPDYAEAHNNLGNALEGLGRLDEAVASYGKAIAIKPDYAEAHRNLGNALLSQGNVDGAVRQLDLALSFNSEKDGWRIQKALLMPIIPYSEEDIRTRRENLGNAVRALQKQNLTVDDPTLEIDMSNFYLAYHARNNKSIMEDIAKLHISACPELTYEAKHYRSKNRERNDRLRIGFLSSYFHDHTIGKLARGIIKNFSRDRFEVVVIRPAGKEDDISRDIENDADKVVRLRKNLTSDWKTIEEQELDILFYFDIGMDPYTYFLAFSRLAPVQAASIGHAETTGIPNVDYFISSELLETADASSHYSEKLIQLPNLPGYYFPTQAPAKQFTRDDYGLPKDARLYIYPQSLFKIYPAFDATLGELLRRDPDGRLVLVSDGRQGYWDNLIVERLGRACPDVVDRVIFVPRMPFDKFLGLLKLADALLDNPYLSGVNSCLESFAVGAPMVAWPGEYCSGRCVTACYQQMGLTDLIATDEESFLELALRLARDKDFKGRMQADIKANSDKLFETDESVRQLENFFITAYDAWKKAGDSASPQIE